MKRNLLKGLILFSIVFFVTELFAQFNLSGEFRPRTEFRHGYKTLSATDADAAFFTSQRTRFNAYYSGEDYKVGFSFQDVRTWGSQKQLNLADDHAGIHEAWGQYFFNKKFSVKLGRQEIIYDDHRIFGSVGWAQQARSHDAAIIKYDYEGLKLDIGLAFNQEKESLFNTIYTLANYKSFQYVWLHKKFNNLGVSVLFLNNGMQFSTVIDSLTTNYDITYSHTYGTRITYKLNKLALAGAFYGQAGNNAANKDLSTTYLAIEALYGFSKVFKGGVGVETLSGNDQVNGDATTDKAFTPFYGTNHKFNGHMDYFYVGNHGGSVGLNDIYATVKYKKEKLSGGLTVHFFSANGSVADPDDATKKMDNKIGTELDLSIGYTLTKGVSFAAGYSQMFGTETLEALIDGNADETNNWAWVMFTFKPNFIKK